MGKGKGKVKKEKDSSEIESYLRNVSKPIHFLYLDIVRVQTIF